MPRCNVCCENEGYCKCGSEALTQSPAPPKEMDELISTLSFKHSEGLTHIGSGIVRWRINQACHALAAELGKEREALERKVAEKHRALEDAASDFNQLKRELAEAREKQEDDALTIASLNCGISEATRIIDRLGTESQEMDDEVGEARAQLLALSVSHQRQKDALQRALSHLGCDPCHLTEALAETPDVSLWQPIESAPKDVPIVLYENWTQELFAIGVVHSKNGYVEGYAMPSGIGVGRASHWMPLPPPPTLQPDHQK